MDNAQLKHVVEALLFITDQPISLAKIGTIVGEKEKDKLAAVIAELKREYEERDAALQVIEIAEGFQMATRQEQAKYVRNLYREKMTMRLSTAALETVSIIAYKQPLTRAEIETIRGVEVIAALETLLEKGLIAVVGRRETVGRPLLYGTTTDFLRQFGLRSVKDLPPLDALAPESRAESAPGGITPGENAPGENAPGEIALPEAVAAPAGGSGDDSASAPSDDEDPLGDELFVGEVREQEPTQDS